MQFTHFRSLFLAHSQSVISELQLIRMSDNHLIEDVTSESFAIEQNDQIKEKLLVSKLYSYFFYNVH